MTGKRLRLFCISVSFFLFMVGLLGTLAQAAELPETINKSLTLTKAEGPFTGMSVSVKEGATLTIGPGTILKLQGQLVIEGSLEVNGTAFEPVVMTSETDDAHGGDTNGDGAASTPTPGEWYGVEFESSGSGFIHHGLVLYGGSAYSGAAALRFHCPCANPAEVSNSMVARSAGGGISISKGSPELTNNTITENQEAGISVISGSPSIMGNTISKNGRGIDFNVLAKSHVEIEIDGNDVADNETSGITIEAEASNQFIDSASLGENLVTGNGGRAITYNAYANYFEVPYYATSPIPPNITTNGLEENGQNGLWLSGSVTENQTWAPSGYAVVIGTNAVVVDKSATLTVGAGSMVKAEGSLNVFGSIHAEGTASSPIAFTAIQNDSAGGDTNGDGELTAPKPGDCGLFVLLSSPESSIAHVFFSYGGYKYFSSYPAVRITGNGSTAPRLVNSTISHSSTTGVELDQTNAELINDTIAENEDNGVEAVSGSAKIYSNQVFNNDMGIYARVKPNTHARIEIDENTVVENSTVGISIDAHGANQYVDFASVGLNVVQGNGSRAVVYDGHGNVFGTSETAADPIPLDITTNILTENGLNGIWLSGTVTEDQTFSATSYALVLTDAFVIQSGSTLFVEDGVVMKNESSPVINGDLLAVGGEEGPNTKPIFTSINDDSVAGDTNGDGSETQAATGDWAGLFVPEGNGQEIFGVEIAYAKTGLYVQTLNSMTMTGSFFFQNDRAVYANGTVGVGPFQCPSPFGGFIQFQGNTFDPRISVREKVSGTVIPLAYVGYFSPWLELDEDAVAGAEKGNSVQLSSFSCEQDGIKNAPVSPVKP